MGQIKTPVHWGDYKDPELDHPPDTKYQDCGLFDADGGIVIDLGVDHYEQIWEDYPTPKHRAEIVQAVNAHDALVKAAKAALKYDESIAGRATRGEYDMAGSHAVGEGDDLDALYLDWITKSGAAIKLAKGE